MELLESRLVSFFHSIFSHQPKLIEPSSDETNPNKIKQQVKMTLNRTNHSHSSNQVIPQKRSATNSNNPSSHSHSNEYSNSHPHPNTFNPTTFNPNNHNHNHGHNHGHNYHSSRPSHLDPAAHHPVVTPAQYDPRATIVLIGMRGVGKVRIHSDLNNLSRNQDWEAVIAVGRLTRGSQRKERDNPEGSQDTETKALLSACPESIHGIDLDMLVSVALKHPSSSSTQRRD